MSLWRDLQKIHHEIKSKFVYVSDMDRYGEMEYWTRSSSVYESDGSINGDCEDFALACQKLCEARGIKNSRLVICKVASGGHHCVLEVAGFILDNREDEVKDKDCLDYEWLKIQDHDGSWRLIEC